MKNMDLPEAKILFLQHVSVTNPDCAIVEESTKEYGKCFVFYYQSKKYIESGRLNDMYVGQGPVLVCKETGALFETGSAFPTEHYVGAFEACGDPFGELTEYVSVSGWNVNANKVQATKLVKAASGMGLKQSKEIIDCALNNQPSMFSAESAAKANKIAAELGNLGFKCRQLWSNQY